MNIRDVVIELYGLLSGLGVSKRGPKAGRPRGLPAKDAPAPVAAKDKGQGKSSSVLTD